MIRTAYIVNRKRTNLEQVQRYLPSNYQAVELRDETIVIVGRDSAGWGLDSYVIPRLASGLIIATEVGNELDD